MSTTVTDATVPPLAPTTASSTLRVVRASRLPNWLTPILAAAGLGLLAFLPAFAPQSETALFVNVFVLLTMALMWNLLAGYAGMVSIGQQAFVGLGAYGVLIFAKSGMEPVASLPLAAIAAAIIALPVSLLVFRLRGGYFAIATWVVADLAMQVIDSISAVGGGTGENVPGLSSLSPAAFGRVTYFAALAVVALALAASYGLLRSRLGLVLAAVRDDEVGARSAGARVMRARRIVFVVAALGCGAAGALLAVSQLQVQPASVFNVQWSAEMIFATLIGGIGTLEGPILGTVIFFVLQQNLANDGAWYLIIFGSLAVLIAIWAPKGIFGLIDRRFAISLFPLGHRVEHLSRPASAPPAPVAANPTSSRGGAVGAAGPPA
ncbi:MAG: branched-chain amino acid ABC transporter permease [Actinomycetota bacterium]|nr:branched-chain amino acid ABC transporter permease [Actinomycetota bacterium]